MPFSSRFVLLSIFFANYVFANSSNYCNNEVIKMNHARREFEEIFNKIEDSPFMLACKNPPGLLKDRPKTNLFRREIPEKDAMGRTSKDLLKAIIIKARAKIDASENQIKKISSCLIRVTPDCEETNRWVKEELPEYIKTARFHLSLAQSQYEAGSLFGSDKSGLNESLQNLGAYKAENWIPLTDDEKEAAQEQLKKYSQDIEQEKANRLKSKQLCTKCVK